MQPGSRDGQLSRASIDFFMLTGREREKYLSFDAKISKERAAIVGEPTTKRGQVISLSKLLRL